MDELAQEVKFPGVFFHVEMVGSFKYAAQAIRGIPTYSAKCLSEGTLGRARLGDKQSDPIWVLSVVVNSTHPFLIAVHHEGARLHVLEIGKYCLT